MTVLGHFRPTLPVLDLEQVELQLSCTLLWYELLVNHGVHDQPGLRARPLVARFCPQENGRPDQEQHADHRDRQMPLQRSICADLKVIESGADVPKLHVYQ